MTQAERWIKAGYRFRREHRLDEAVRAFTEAVTLAKTDGDTAVLARAFVGLGRELGSEAASFVEMLRMQTRVASPELADGYHAVPLGKLATIVTSLEMCARPSPPVEPERKSWSIEHRCNPDLDWYRTLFRRIGASYLWASRLELSDAALETILSDPRVEVYCVTADGDEAGIVELDFRVPGECELTYFGVTSRWIGSGLGRWMMHRAIEAAWSKPIARFWLHTCSLDHPAALPFYRKAGFVPFRCDVEIFSDPRATGVYAADIAPHVPFFVSVGNA